MGACTDLGGEELGWQECGHRGGRYPEGERTASPILSLIPGPGASSESANQQLLLFLCLLLQIFSSHDFQITYLSRENRKTNLQVSVTITHFEQLSTHFQSGSSPNPLLPQIIIEISSFFIAFHLIFRVAFFWPFSSVNYCLSRLSWH